jgi:glycosyltransferase involved in cell wall biosynthesis
LSRLSLDHEILFVETLGPDPGLAAPTARYRVLDSHPRITVLQVQFPSWRWGDGDYVDLERRRLVQDFVRSGPVRGRFERPVQWFYDPMAVTAFAGQMDEIVTVYDCMDELSQFKGAPPNLRERELQLLAVADVVFTGGRRLWEAKRRRNPNCHFYGCGVDVGHFSKARRAETALPPELAERPQPILGYFGVVDERMDYELVADLADADPNWSVVMVGPVTKVDPASLPQRPNLHWLGGRDYAQLPMYCKAFDVCLMPFALNASTEYINPTKALEYMATARPIVSTAVPDVVRNFGEVVQIADRGSFIELCRRAATERNAEALERGLAMAQANTWESIVAKLEHHLAEAVRVRANQVNA